MSVYNAIAAALPAYAFLPILSFLILDACDRFSRVPRVASFQSARYSKKHVAAVGAFRLSCVTARARSYR